MNTLEQLHKFLESHKSCSSDCSKVQRHRNTSQYAERKGCQTQNYKSCMKDNNSNISDLLKIKTIKTCLGGFPI